jgi:hypothetical protein
MPNLVAVKLPPKSLVIVEEEQGSNFQICRCLACEAGGWTIGDLGLPSRIKKTTNHERHLQHTAECPLNYFLDDNGMEITEQIQRVAPKNSGVKTMTIICDYEKRLVKAEINDNPNIHGIGGSVEAALRNMQTCDPDFCPLFENTMSCQ